MNGMKCPGVPVFSYLDEDSTIQTKLAFHNGVQEIVRHDRVISGRRIHLD